jgi:hypothetical protein
LAEAKGFLQSRAQGFAGGTHLAPQVHLQSKDQPVLTKGQTVGNVSSTE